MARVFHSQIVTANDLLSGDVVYLTAQHVWSGALVDAAVSDTPEAASEFLAIGAAQQDIIVGAYLVDVQRDETGTAQPLHFREAFRMRGPSNYFHGKQAEV